MFGLDYIQCSDDARIAAKRRLPWMIFDFIDGSAGDGRTAARNRAALAAVELEPRVLGNATGRRLRQKFLGRDWGLPFGIAPMGMCDLTWPGTDRAYGDAAVRHSIPHCLSTAASTSLEDCRTRAGENAWFQLYVSTPEAGWDLVRRAATAGYEHLILTVDTPVVSRRRCELRHGFAVPFHIGPTQFIDFALHPRWSISTLLQGVPQFRNNQATQDDATRAFDRSKSRSGADWDFLDALRERWRGKLIVKGVLSASDALRIKNAGVDAIYVSNHGGRQLDSAPPAIHRLPLIRQAVGPDYPLLFDSGLRDGEDIIKAYALGADFVMLGRPFLYAAGAAGAPGVNRLIELLTAELHSTLAQLGAIQVAELDRHVVVLGSLSGANMVSPEEQRPQRDRHDRVTRDEHTSLEAQTWQPSRHTS